MGTCVGKRNLKYFLSFLLMTGVHAVVTAIICGAYFAAVTVNIDTFDWERSLERNIGLLSVGVGLYAAVIGATLICFFLYSLRLMLNNITSMSTCERAGIPSRQSTTKNDMIDCVASQTSL